MAFIIPDKVLETLICDSCHKYLSVKPIKVFPNRRIKCGRCCRSKKQSDGVVSLYGVIADKCLFKCINRFDGCRTLLTYSQVRDHEKVCTSKQYKCPMCPESTDIPTFLIGKHFRENHKDSILDYPGFLFNFDVPSESSVIYLYQQDDNLFFIFLTSSQLEENIKLSFLYLGDSKDAKNIYQQLTVSNVNKLDITLKPKPCFAYLSTDCDYFSVNLPYTSRTIIKFSIIYKVVTLIKLPEGITLNTTSSLIGPTIPAPCESMANTNTYFPMVKEERIWRIYLTPQFHHRFPYYALTPSATAITIKNSDGEYFFHCSNCQEICWRGLSNDVLVQRFYRNTTLNYSICYYCFQFLRHEKEVTDSDYTLLNFPSDLLKHVEFYCKWNCCITFNVHTHLGHEYACKLQSLQVCPEYNCRFQGTIFEIAIHMANHPGKEVCAFSNFYISALFDRNIYVYLNKRFVYFNVNSHHGLNLKVHMVSDDDTRDCEKWKPIVLLFDDNKKFQMPFQNSITKIEANHWVKIILTEA